MSDVVQFPKSKMPDESDELQKAAKELEQVNVQRKAAVQGLRDKVRNLLEQDNINAEHMSPASVMALRDAIKGLSYSLSGLEAHDKMMDMITHDIIGLVQNVDALSQHLFQTSAFTQTLLEVLKNKGFVTNEDMKQTWAQMVAAKKPTTPESV